MLCLTDPLLGAMSYCSCFSTRSFLLLADRLVSLQTKQQSPKQQSPQQSGSKLGSRATSRTFSGLMADVPACLSFSDLSNSYPADFEHEYGPNHPSRELVRTARRVVVKVQYLLHVCGSTCSIFSSLALMSPLRLLLFCALYVGPS